MSSTAWWDRALSLQQKQLSESIYTNTETMSGGHLLESAYVLFECLHEILFQSPLYADRN